MLATAIGHGCELQILPDERKAAIRRELALLAEPMRRTFPDLDQERASEQCSGELGGIE